jgi:hypothetical protein
VCTDVVVCACEIDLKAIIAYKGRHWFFSWYYIDSGVDSRVRKNNLPVSVAIIANDYEIWQSMF